MKKIMITFFLLCIALMMPSMIAQGEQRASYGEPLCTYESDDGISIISFSYQWNTQGKLESVYRELLENGHGEEIDYLSTIYIYPDSPEGVASYYYDDYYLDENGTYQYMDGRYIEIFDGDTYTSLSEIARLISHEYGHHVFFYYYINNENILKSDWVNSEYGKIRGLDNLDQVTYLGDTSKPYFHEWDIVEIIADDYVQLYGSDLAKGTRDYLDVEERIEQDIKSYNYYYQDFNLRPQENLQLPLAADVEGLSDYFYELTNIDFKYRSEDLSVKAPELVEINDVYGEFNEYIFKWEKVSNNEPRGEYEYTLLINELNDSEYPIPIKTVYSGEPLYAVAGSAIDFSKGTALLNNYEGDYEIRVIVKDSYGFMHSSEPVHIAITPKDNSKVIFRDVPNNYWAINYIYDLTNKNLTKGYPDNTFKPEESITIAEFATILVRSISGVSFNTIDYEYDWFYGLGYREVAISIGLIEESDDYDYYGQNISRDEMARFIYIMLELYNVDVDVNFTSFSDITAENNRKEISVAKYYGIINGYGDNTYKPEKEATRAEAMKMISTYLEVID